MKNADEWTLTCPECGVSMKRGGGDVSKKGGASRVFYDPWPPLSRWLVAHLRDQHGMSENRATIVVDSKAVLTRPEPTEPAARPLPTQEYTQEEVVQKYADGWSIDRIANNCTRSARNVKAVLLRNGVALRHLQPSKPNSIGRKSWELRQLGWTWVRIGKELGVHERTARKVSRQHETNRMSSQRRFDESEVWRQHFVEGRTFASLAVEHGVHKSSIARAVLLHQEMLDLKEDEPPARSDEQLDCGNFQARSGVSGTCEGRR